MGVIAAAGDLPEALWRAVVRGVSPAVHFSDPAAPGSPVIPACVVAGPGEEALKQRRSHKMDRCVQLALEAAVQAHSHAGLRTRLPDPSSIGIVAGTSPRAPRQGAGRIELSPGPRPMLPPTPAAPRTPDSLSRAASL